MKRGVDVGRRLLPRPFGPRGLAAQHVADIALDHRPCVHGGQAEFEGVGSPLDPVVADDSKDDQSVNRAFLTYFHVVLASAARLRPESNPHVAHPAVFAQLREQPLHVCDLCRDAPERADVKVELIGHVVSFAGRDLGMLRPELLQWEILG